MEKYSTGKIISQLRKDKGWTQIELAEKLQVSDKAVSKWEQDNGLPSIEFFPKMARLFGVSIDYLMTGENTDDLPINIPEEKLKAESDEELLSKLEPIIKNGIIDIQELLKLNNYRLTKLAFETYHIHTAELLCHLLNENKWRALFEYCVDKQLTSHFETYFRNLTDAIMDGKRENIEREIVTIFNNQMKNSFENDDLFVKHYREMRFSIPPSQIIDIEKICHDIKDKILESLYKSIDKERIIAELTQEFFESELEKGNTDIVIIKLCVRMEAILRYYGYEGTFEEMLSKYCSKLNGYQDKSYNTLLHKLRIYRNSITHPGKFENNMTIDEVKKCISYICKLN